MEKLVRNGQVAVAVSGGYGAGWSTWNSVNPMDARFNVLFDEGKHQEAAELCESLEFGYAGGAEDVVLVWVPLGTEFVITEYDGAEILMTKEDYNWLTA
jgi:hypothetical protein